MKTFLRSRGVGKSLLLLAAAGVAVVPVAALPPSLAMLGTLSKGAWTLRLRDDGSQQRICVRDGSEFVQLRHRVPGCKRFIIKDGANEVVVQYTCPGSGYGMTTIRSEGPELVQVQTQGILNGTPFSISGEARRTGRC